MSKKPLCINVITIALILMASTAFAQSKLTVLTSTHFDQLEIGTDDEAEVQTGNTVDVDGAVTITGTLDMDGTSVLECTGTFTDNGTLEAESGTQVTFNGTTQSIAGSADIPFQKVVFSGGAKTFDANATINNSIDAGGQDVTISVDKTLTLASTSVATISGGSWTVTGALSADNASEIIYTSSSPQNVIPANHGKLTHNGAGALSLGANLTCGGLLTNTTGNFTAGTYSLTAPGIVWTAGSVTATPSGAWDIGSTGVDVNGGTFVATSGALTVEGDWDMTGATAFTPGTGSVDFDGSGAQTITSALKPFYSVDISNASAAVSMADKFEFNANGTLTIDGGAIFALAGNEFDDNVGTITNNGTFQLNGDETLTTTALSIPGNSKFVDPAGCTLTTGIAELANVEFNSNGFTFILGEDMTFITGDITVATGTTLDMTGYDITLASGKIVTNNGTWTAPTSESDFVCSGDANFTGSNGVKFYDFSSTVASAILIFENGVTYEVDGVLTLTGTGGNEIDLKSSSGGSQFTIQNYGDAESVSYVKVTDCAATISDIDATYSWAVSNVTGWNFGVILFTSQVGGNWNTAGTWDQVRVPTSSDNVKVSHAIILDTSPTVSDLTIDTEKSLACGTYTITVSGSSDINGTATISTGTYDANGSFDANGGTITFSGAGTLELASTVTSLGTLSSNNGTVNYNGTAQNVFADDYNSLTLSGSGIKTLGGAITTAGNLTIGTGVTLDVSVTNYGISVAGNWANGGTFTPQSGIVTLIGNGVADQTVITNAQAFYNLTLNNDEVTKVNAVISGILDVNNDLTLTDGTLDLNTNGPNVFIGNALSIANGAVWTKGAGTTTFDGAACTLTDNNAAPNNLGIIKVD